MVVVWRTGYKYASSELNNDVPCRRATNVLGRTRPGVHPTHFELNYILYLLFYRMYKAYDFCLRTQSIVM